MKKPLLVATLLFAGLIGGGLARGTTMLNRNTVGTTSAAGFVNQDGPGNGNSTSRTTAGASDSSTTLFQSSASSNAAPDFLESDTCSAVKVEAPPCQ
jgi:hypothetical protein